MNGKFNIDLDQLGRDLEVQGREDREMLGLAPSATSTPTLREQIAAHDHSKLVELHARLIEESCDTDTHIREVAKKFGIDTVGDSFGVPCVEDLVDAIAGKVDQLRADVRPLVEAHIAIDKFDNEETEGTAWIAEGIHLTLKANEALATFLAAHPEFNQTEL